MNLIQIATSMGGRLKFGDLPKYSFIISEINKILPEENHITATTTGSGFMEIYNSLKPDMQNRLASVIEDDIALRLEIASDLTMFEVSRQSNHRRAFQDNARLILIITAMLVLINLYIAFAYHQHAIAIQGEYNSTFMGVIKHGFEIIAKFIPTE